MGERIMYGVPDYDGRGFKVADDTREGAFDPSTADREVRVRNWHRFDSTSATDFQLYGCAMTEARVCQYSNSPNGHFLLDQHPEAENVFLAGAGCGHGFKLGPVLGRMMAERVLEALPIPEVFRLESLQSTRSLSNQFEH
ncbi:FAD-dependent oxidoreductase [Okeania hirsuta]|uniref:FAD-dependent oxidoreductase n=2 Tax=Okeania hirsuta TaxID=1458930 RepID=A0A3N6QNU1_9CYAN|nr:FAD-dependent oxidoreductase [Okeania hirsuta]